MEEKPCCAEAAARKTKKLIIDGSPIGLIQLDQVMDEIRKMGLHGETEIADALLKRVKNFNYVPLSASSKYKNALLAEYHRREGL